MLEDLGLRPIEVLVYRQLLALGPSPASAVSAAASVTEAETAKALAALENHGLLSRSADVPPVYQAAPPDIALEPLILRRRASLEQIRTEAAELVRLFRRSHGGDDVHDVVQLLSGPAAVAMHVARLQSSAVSEVMIADRPPYISPEGPSEHCLNSTEIEALGRGVSYRVIYHGPSLSEGGPDALRRYADAGEQARVLPDVPVKLLIVDRETAVLPLGFDRQSDSLLVRGSALLSVLIECFESLWSRGVPVLGRPASAAPDESRDAGLSSMEHSILQLMAAGVKDETIARTVGVSIRTLGRYIDKLMHDLGATTRFQAGLQVARLGRVGGIDDGNAS